MFDWFIIYRGIEVLAFILYLYVITFIVFKIRLHHEKEDDKHENKYKTMWEELKADLKRNYDLGHTEKTFVTLYLIDKYEKKFNVE